MKIGDQSVHHLETVARINEDGGVICPCMHNAVLICCRLYSAAAGGSNTDDAFSPGMGLVDEICSSWRYVVPLSVHVMLRHIIHLDRAEGSKSYMKRDIGQIDSLVLNLFQKLLGKMKPCRRRCRASVKLRIHCLVHVRIFQLVCDVRRQRHLTEPVQHLLKNSIIIKLHQTISIVQNIHDFCGQRAVAKGHSRSRAKLLAGTHQCLPDIILTPLQQKNFRICAGSLLGSEESCRNHSGVVQNQRLSRLQVINNVMENLMLQLTGIPVNAEHSAAVPLLIGILRNQFLWQVKIIIRGLVSKRHIPAAPCSRLVCGSNVLVDFTHVVFCLCSYFCFLRSQLCV